MKLELASMTPYILFMFGLIITYIGWTTKKILENIEKAIEKTANKVDRHDHHISEILSVLKIHDLKIQSLNDHVEELRNSDKI